MSLFEKKFGLPLHYYVFSKIIQEKLILGGIKLDENVDEKITGLP